LQGIKEGANAKRWGARSEKSDKSGPYFEESIMSAPATDRDRTASSKGRLFGERTAADRWFDWLAPVIFSLFMASLITLLILAYAGVPLI
jgi:hypothetical protein